jgi:hypothetical protein
VELFIEYYLRGFIKYLICVQNILETDESTNICTIFGLNTNTKTNVTDIEHCGSGDPGSNDGLKPQVLRGFP